MVTHLGHTERKFSVRSFATGKLVPLKFTITLMPHYTMVRVMSNIDAIDTKREFDFFLTEQNTKDLSSLINAVLDYENLADVLEQSMLADQMAKNITTWIRTERREGRFVRKF